MPELLYQETDQDDSAIMTVIVLFRRSPENSAAFESLISCEGDSGGNGRCAILVFDNTPGGQNSAGLPEHVIYHAAGRNEGIAGAYNFALEMAEREGAKWLLTLDQDTRLPAGFLTRLRCVAREREAEARIAAIVPQLVQGDTVLSPYRVLPWGIRYLPRGFQGIAAGEIHGLNSGSLFRVQALREIGGFDPRFWLDYQDYSTFRALHQNGKSVWVAGDLQVEHDLSLISDRESMGEERLRNFLEAETAFSDLSGSWVSGLALTGRLTVRLWRQHRRGADPITRRMTREALSRRLRFSRRQRLQEWNAATRQRAAQASGKTDGRRSRISVCMATYNGEAYVGRQLRSILSQLAENDEVIVVDDASTDRTCEIVRNLGDGRIQMERHPSNLGVLRTFEDSISRARGDVVFLADQDDLWAPEKVSSVLQEFSAHPEADIVVSDAALIDENGAVVGPSYYATRSPFRPGLSANLFHCRYLGCTMAFQSRIRSRVLPFPSGADVLHDLWIGTANALAGGKVIYLDRPLVFYRRHGENATGGRRLPLRRQLRMRWDLCRSLIQAWRSGRFSGNT